MKVKISGKDYSKRTCICPFQITKVEEILWQIAVIKITKPCKFIVIQLLLKLKDINTFIYVCGTVCSQ